MLKKIQPKPGVNRENTNYTTEGGWYESEKIRFRQGTPEKIGGWSRISIRSFVGVCRSLWAWSTLAGRKLIGTLTDRFGYITYNGTYNNCSPIPNNTTATDLTFTVTNGSSIVSININPYPQSSTFNWVGVPLTIYGVTGNVGNYPKETFNNRWFTVTSTVYGVSVSFDCGVVSTTTASPTMTGSAVRILEPMYSGYYSQANFGQDQILAQRGGRLCFWNGQYGFMLGGDPVSVTFQDTGDTVTAAAHGLVNGNQVVFTSITSTTGIVTNTVYYVISSTTNTFQVASTFGGSTIALTTNGSGTMTLEGNNVTIVSNATVAVTFTDAGDLVTATAHGLSNGYQVVFKTIVSTTGIVIDTVYYVISATTNTFQVAATHGGAAIVLTANGSGTMVTGTTVTTTQACPANTSPIPVLFSSSGALPTPLLFNVYYYLYPTVSGVSTNGATKTFGLVGPAQISPLVSTLVPTVLTGATPVDTSLTVRVNSRVLAAHPDPADEALSADYPDKVSYVFVSDTSRFVFAFGCNTYGTSNNLGTSTLDPMLVRWSNQEDYTNWTPSATNQVGDLVLSRGSEIITALQARQEVLCWTDSALYSLQYLGPPIVWGSQIVGDNISIVSQNCAVYAVGIAMWMGKDKFYQYSGQTQTLVCDLRKYIFNDININEYDQIFAVTNEGFNEAWWFYCSANSSTIDRYVIYNYAEKIWSYGTMTRTAGLDTGIFDYPMMATTSPTNNIVNHEYGVDDNATGTPVAIAASITSSEIDADDGDSFMFIRRVLPDITFSGSTAATPSGLFTLKPLANSGSGYTTPASVGGEDDASVTRSATVPIEAFTGQVYIRIRGRQIVMKWESTALGVAWQLGSMRLDMKADGKASGRGV